ncbi:hypothetical protein ACQJ0Y_23080 [Peribacillus simplex]
MTSVSLFAAKQKADQEVWPALGIYVSVVEKIAETASVLNRIP